MTQKGSEKSKSKKFNKNLFNLNLFACQQFPLSFDLLLRVEFESSRRIVSFSAQLDSQQRDGTQQEKWTCEQI